MRITIIRHGQTIHNKEKRIQGQLQGRLTKLGKTQDKLSSKQLKNELTN